MKQPQTYRATKAAKRPAPYRAVRITQAHIDTAERKNSRLCALAQALGDVGALRPIIHRGRISFTINGERFSYVAPPTVAQFIRDYDEEGPGSVRPGTVRLREGVVTKCYRSGGTDRNKGAKRRRKDGRATNRPLPMLSTSTRVDGFVVPTRKKG